MNILSSLTRAAHCRAFSPATCALPTRIVLGRPLIKVSPFTRLNASLATVRQRTVLQDGPPKDALSELTSKMENLSLKTKRLPMPPLLFLFHLNGMSAALEQATKKLQVFEALALKANALQEEAKTFGVLLNLKIEPSDRRSSDLPSCFKALNHIEFCLRSLDNTEASTRCFIKKVEEQLKTLKAEATTPAVEKIKPEKIASELQTISEALKWDIRQLEKAESVVLDASESERLKELYNQVNLAYAQANAVFNNVLLLHCELAKASKKA